MRQNTLLEYLVAILGIDERKIVKGSKNFQNIMFESSNSFYEWFASGGFPMRRSLKAHAF